MENTVKASFMFLIFFCTSLTFTHSGRIGKPGRYSGRCNTKILCNREAGLLCLNGFCGCSQPDRMAYDAVRQRCAVKHNNPCVPPEYDFGEYNPCVSRARCSEITRLCECDQSSWSKNGICIPKRFYGEACESDSECDDFRYFVCDKQKGVCACKEGVFDEYAHVCRRKVGQSCRRSRECVRNAYCEKNGASTGICTCIEGFSPSAEKGCSLGWGQSCFGIRNNEANVTEQCSDVHFACINGRCECKNPSYEIYDKGTQACLSLVGGLCHLYMGNPDKPLELKSCVANAICKRRGNTALSQCECEAGFVETISGKCQLAFGSPCIESSSLNVTSTPCDESIPLTCLQGKCSCSDPSEIYSVEMRSCLRRAGSPCDFTHPCIANARCSENGICTCEPTFILDHIQGRCVLPQSR